MESAIAWFHLQNFNTYITESVDHVYTHSIPVTVALYGTITTLIGTMRYTLIVSDVSTHNTQVGLEQAFQYGHSYTVALFGTISLYKSTIERDALDQPVDGPRILISTVRTRITSFPLMTGTTIMTHSSLTDNGVEYPSGITCVNGKPRTIPSVKVLRFDHPIRLEHKDTLCIQIRSNHHSKPHRSTSTIEIVVDKVSKRASRVGLISVALPFVAQTVPVSVLFFAFGIQTVDAIVTLLRSVAGDRYDASIFRPYEISIIHGTLGCEPTQHAATLYISQLFNKNIVSTGLNIIRNEVFPHLNDSATDPVQFGHWHKKSIYMAIQVVSLILFQHGRLPPSNRDAYIHCQLTTPGALLGQLFRLFFLPHMRMISKLLRRALTACSKRHTAHTTTMDARTRDMAALNGPEPSVPTVVAAENTHVDLVKLFGQYRLSARILSAVAKGTWSLKRKGVTIALNTNNDDAVDCQLRRVSSSLSSTDGVHSGPRNVQLDQYGYVCPASTPGGEAVGLVYSLAQFASVTTLGPSPCLLSDHILDELLGLSRFRLGCEIQPQSVFVTNHLGHICHILPSLEYAHDVVLRFLELRRDGHIHPYVFIVFDRTVRDLRILVQEGLFIRSLLVVSRLNRYSMDYTYSELKRRGIIEDVTPAEEQSICNVAARLADIVATSTHVELSESSFLAALTACVPFATSQQGPRLSYYSSQIKQFIVPSYRSSRKGAMSMSSLSTAHRDLTTTQTALLMPGQQMSRGVPMVVAFLCVSDAQEDAVVLKRSSMERGALHCTTSRVYQSDALIPTASHSEVFEVSETALARKDADYSALNPATGLPNIRSRIASGGIVIGKTRSSKTSTSNGVQIVKRDISTFAKVDEGGHVVESSLLTMPLGTRSVVIVETGRKPNVGDKLSTRFSQKGVIGAIMNDEDMPFSIKTGVAPDIIVSPLSMTSRMTMGALVECLTGKAVAVTGDLSLGVDKQEFAAGTDMRVIGEHLQAHGYQRDGLEVFMDGRTGEMIRAHVFTGIITYMRLVHLSERKKHVRSTGPRDVLTRQPRDGRKHGGGLRAGEMETAAFVAHGAAAALQARACTFADAHIVYICGNCETLCDGNMDTGYYWCEVCDDNESVRRVRIPYAMLVTANELLATGIDVRFIIRGQDDLQDDEERHTMILEEVVNVYSEE